MADERQAAALDILARCGIIIRDTAPPETHQAQCAEVSAKDLPRLEFLPLACPSVAAPLREGVHAAAPPRAVAPTRLRSRRRTLAVKFPLPRARDGRRASEAFVDTERPVDLFGRCAPAFSGERAWDCFAGRARAPCCFAGRARAPCFEQVNLSRVAAGAQTKSTCRRLLESST